MSANRRGSRGGAPPRPLQQCDGPADPEQVRPGRRGVCAARQATPRCLRGDAGASLVEVVVGLLVLGVGVSVVSTSFTGGMRSLYVSRQRDAATADASHALESARALPYARLALPSGTGTTFDPDGPGPLPAESVHATSDGLISGPPYAHTPTPRTVRTQVTLPDPTDPKLRRVTVIVTWTHGDRQHEVRHGTLVADVPRS